PVLNAVEKSRVSSRIADSTSHEALRSGTPEGKGRYIKLPPGQRLLMCLGWPTAPVALLNCATSYRKSCCGKVVVGRTLSSTTSDGERGAASYTGEVIKPPFSSEQGTQVRDGRWMLKRFSHVHCLARTRGGPFIRALPK